MANPRDDLYTAGELAKLFNISKQFLKFLELFEKDKEVVFMNPKGESMTLKVSELCPYPFDDTDLM